MYKLVGLPIICTAFMWPHTGYGIGNSFTYSELSEGYLISDYNINGNTYTTTERIWIPPNTGSSLVVAKPEKQHMTDFWLTFKTNEAFFELGYDASCDPRPTDTPLSLGINFGSDLNTIYGDHIDVHNWNKSGIKDIRGNFTPDGLKRLFRVTTRSRELGIVSYSSVVCDVKLYGVNGTLSDIPQIRVHSYVTDYNYTPGLSTTPAQANVNADYDGKWSAAFAINGVAGASSFLTATSNKPVQISYGRETSSYTTSVTTKLSNNISRFSGSMIVSGQQHTAGGDVYNILLTLNVP